MFTQVAASVLLVVTVGLLLVAAGDSNSKAIELLSNHHHSDSWHDDAGRLEELSRLADAAKSEANTAAALKSTEAEKLEVSPESKVDAELMLAREATKKSKMLRADIKTVGSKLRVLKKTLRRDHHSARQEGRALHKVRAEMRDSMLALHDKEMKVMWPLARIQNIAHDNVGPASAEGWSSLGW